MFVVIERLENEIVMRITVLNRNPNLYSGNSFLIRGDSNSLKDVNTLVDSGSDGYIISEIETIYTGVGKKAVEQVLLTHRHFDHSGGLKFLMKRYNPKVYAFSPGEFVSHIIKDDDLIKVGDSLMQVIHTPGHSNDSVCYYNSMDRILFSGDCPINIRSIDDTFSDAFVKAFEKLVSLPIDVVYPGHGVPIKTNVKKLMNESLDMIYKSRGRGK